MARQFFNKKTIKQDLIAGLVLGLESIPDGLGQGVLALVNPAYGLYAYMVGAFTGAFFTSSVFMTVQATSAMSLIIADVPQITQGSNIDASLFALSILTGLFMLGAGLLRFGSSLRFVPNSVMVGFINAVAVLMILGQLGNLTGYSAAGGNKITQTLNLLLNLDQISLPNLIVGIATILLIIFLKKTRLKTVGIVMAIFFVSIAVVLAGWSEVFKIGDIASIPTSLPRPQIPPLSVMPPLIIPAFALAFVGLIQGAGVSKSYLNPDGKYSDSSGDFRGQGAANIFSGIFQGMPVGGSVSATALVTSSGAKSRFANIFAGIIIGVMILFFGKLISYVALPAIAALIIIVGFGALQIANANLVWETGFAQRATMLGTFLASLIIPLQYAVLLGILIAIILYFFRKSNQITVKQWSWKTGGLATEKDPPEFIPSNKATFLIFYGSQFFATAPLIKDKMPKTNAKTHNAAIILSLRGRKEVGSTFITTLEEYIKDLKKHKSKLFLAGVDSRVKKQMDKTGFVEVIGEKNIFLHTTKIDESSLQAWDVAQKWVQKGK